MINQAIGQAGNGLRNIGIAVSRAVIQFEIFHKLTPSEYGLRGSVTKQCDETSAAIAIFDARNTLKQVVFSTISSTVFSGISVSLSSTIFCGIPRIVRTEYHAGNRHARIVDMPKITPIGDEHAFRTAVDAVARDA